MAGQFLRNLLSATATTVALLNLNPRFVDADEPNQPPTQLKSVGDERSQLIAIADKYVTTRSAAMDEYLGIVSRARKGDAIIKEEYLLTPTPDTNQKEKFIVNPKPVGDGPLDPSQNLVGKCCMLYNIDPNPVESVRITPREDGKLVVTYYEDKDGKKPIEGLETVITTMQDPDKVAVRHFTTRYPTGTKTTFHTGYDKPPQALVSYGVIKPDLIKEQKIKTIEVAFLAGQKETEVKITQIDVDRTKGGYKTGLSAVQKINAAERYSPGR